MKLYYKDEYIRLFQGDCLEVMDKLIEKGIKFNAIITDPPYGTTQCKWDSVIPFNDMWERLNKLIIPNGAIVLFGSQPYTSALIMSQVKLYKYNWVWEKDNASNFFAAKFQPLNNTEDICVFSTGGCNNGTKNPVPYYPQGVKQVEIECVNGKNVGGLVGQAHKTAMKEGKKYTQNQTGYPFKILKFKRDANKSHPTQKPIALMEYLINTYTNENELILDFTCGSGSTLIATKNLKRKCIGIELEEKYCEIAKSRLIA